MAVITITIPPAIDSRVLNAVARQNGWTPNNPLTRAQYVKKILLDKLKDDLILFEAHAAAEAARDTARATAKTVGNDIT